MSNYLHDLLRSRLQDYLPDPAEYEETFDVFEYLLGMTYMDLVRKNRAPLGRFGWRMRRGRTRVKEQVDSWLDQGGELRTARGGLLQ